MLTAEQVTRFREDGFIKGSLVADEETVDVLRMELERVIANRDKTSPQPVHIVNLTQDAAAPIWQIVNIWQASEPFRRLMEHPDAAVREQAARDWCAWEDAAIAHETLGKPGQYSAKIDADRMAFVRICTHYFAHTAWLEDGQLLRDAHRLDGIPGVLIHGRLDLSAPVRTAWELAQAWPGAELRIIEDSGHTGSPAMAAAIAEAVERFTPPRI